MGLFYQDFALVILGLLLFSEEGNRKIGSLAFYQPRKPKIHNFVLDKADDEIKCQFGPGWVNLMGGCYLITDKIYKWDDAMKGCETLDSQAEFGTLWTAADMEVVSSMMKTKNVKTIFVNGKFVTIGSDFLWYHDRPVSTQLTPWGKDEPKTKGPNQVITLTVPEKEPSFLAAVPLDAAPLRILCKRPAKGFRRRTADEIQSYTNRLSKGPHGWRLANSHSRNSQTEAEKIQSRSLSQNHQESPAVGSSAINNNNPSSSSFLSGLKGTNSLNSISALKTAPTVTTTTAMIFATVAAPLIRGLPPPISKYRHYEQNTGQFETVMPVDKSFKGKGIQVSAIEPVDVVDLVKAREDKLNQMFGRSDLRLKDAMALYPEDYRYPSTDYQRMAHVLTTELIAQDQRDRKTDAPFEKAKVITMKLFAKGRAIQCFFGDKDEVISNRQVECIATAGVIDSCVKQVLLTGKNVRGCGLPGTERITEQAGCVKTTNGEMCYCNHDYCNAAVAAKFSFIAAVSFVFFVYCLR